MFRYKNEAAFSAALTKAMKDKHWLVQRIESGLTGRGIPDLYCITPENVAIWIELKRVHSNASSTVTIPWRPGQQSWLMAVTKRRQHAMTLACFDNAILRILHNRVYKDNIVEVSDCRLYHSLQEVVQ